MMKIFLKKFSNCGCYLDFCIVYEVKGKKDIDFRLRKEVDNNDVSLNVKKYRIGNTTYVSKSCVKPDYKDTILTKIGKLIKNDLAENYQ